MKKIAKGFNSRKEHHCPNCGGLLPELSVIFENKLYKFTCYEIESMKTGKVLKKTDYKKFQNFLQNFLR